ncbi:hypothetical protein [Halalkalibacillus halophilus]|uniref:hypothetical protein n=1 Tax=Halalkalibacillus halophilus TaxID=392827 RepID=UPI00040BB70E|nr:hypothetical protein [Halalkalibacillus halophilus]
MNEIPNFTIKNRGPVSDCFYKIGVQDFHQAIHYAGNLPYGRNSDRSNYYLMFKEEVGTCSTKHAALAKLCEEQNVEDILLFTGIYEMDGINTPGIGEVLEKYNLKALPEAHCYLKYEGQHYDFTRSETSENEISYFLDEKAIRPWQIGADKEEYHQSYISHWIKKNGLEPKYTPDEIWKIREACIHQLAVKG